MVTAPSARGGQRGHDDHETASVSFSNPIHHDNISKIGGKKKSQVEGMVEAIILALKFMPLDAAPLAVLVTDGCESHPPHTRYDGVKMRLCRYDVVVSCVLIDGSGAAKTLSNGARGSKGWRSRRRRGSSSLGSSNFVSSSSLSPSSIICNPFEPLDKCLVPSSTGLAHMAAVTGGWFYTLETLRAALDDGGHRVGGAAAAVSGIGGVGKKRGVRMAAAAKMGPSAGQSVFPGSGEGDGPSEALCQVRWVRYPPPGGGRVGMLC